ncbi:MAG: transketolase family protein, partial [Candidatus Humimicrobiaceae bacterium]
FRDTFGKEILEIGTLYKNVAVVTADLSDATRVTEFSNKFPDNFFQVGIAEQNMVSVAAGLSLNGKKCFCTTFASFASLRCCEQVRNDICYQNLDVKIVGIDSGVSTGFLGVTHYGLEDIAIMRAFPNMVIVSPSDCLALAKLLWEVTEFTGPAYIRLSGGKDIPVIYEKDMEFKLGKSITLLEGGDVTIIATGLMVFESLKAAKALKEKGIHCTVIDMHTIRPLDKDAIKENAKKTGIIVTVEEHNITGGLGSAIAEVIAENGFSSCRLFRLGLPDAFLKVGSHKNLLERFGLNSTGISDKILTSLCS